MPSRPSGPGDGKRLAVTEVVRLVAPARARPLSFALNIAHVGDGRAGAERHAGG
jgi:hypothetical protein